jgi:hypothetical protein
MLPFRQTGPSTALAAATLTAAPTNGAEAVLLTNASTTAGEVAYFSTQPVDDVSGNPITALLAGATEGIPVLAGTQVIVAVPASGLNWLAQGGALIATPVAILRT